MAYEFRIVEGAPVTPLAAIRERTGPDIGQALGKLLPEVFGWLGKAGVAPAGQPLVRYFEMQPGSADIEAALPIGPEAAKQLADATPAGSSGRVSLSELPGGTLAVTTHLGPYDRLGEAHDAFRDWLGREGRTPTGPPWEVYVTDPGEEPDPSRWETQVFYPL